MCATSFWDATTGSRHTSGYALGSHQGQGWSRRSGWLDLVFLPLMHHVRLPVAVVSGALALALQLPEEEQRQTLAALIGLGQRFLEQQELDALLEGLMATNLGQQLLDRGWAVVKRDDVLKVPTTRFGAVPAAWNEQLQQVSDVERLDALLDAALAAQSLEEFVQTLNNSLTP